MAEIKDGRFRGKEDFIFRTIIENANDMISFHDIEGFYIYVSPSCEKILGYKPEEIIGHGAYEFVADEDLVRLAEHHKKSLKDKIDPPKILFRIKRKNDVPVWVESYSKLVSTGNEAGILVISREVTERIRTEDALKKSEANFRELYENMSEGVALHDVVFGDDGTTPVNYRILDVNPAYSMHTGLPREAARNKLASELYGTAEPPYLKEFCDVGTGGKAYHFETYFPPMEKHFRISVISPSYGKFATVFEDITERKKKEKELSDRNAELERFVYTVSHDLKNPLITIKGFVGMLSRDINKNDTVAVADDLSRIGTAADKMKFLLDDLLHLSKSGRVVGEYKDIDLAVVMAELKETLQAAIEHSGAKLEVSETLGHVRGDKQRVMEVFQNLIENAIKYAKPGVAPEIKIGEEMRGTERVFYVRDNGLGIDVKYSVNIFGLFNKLDPQSEGTGIGLALVKRIIEAHGGRIWLISDGKSGSEFCFTIPGINI